MQPSRGSHNGQRSFFVTTRANPGDILFSTTNSHDKSLTQHLAPPHHNSAVFSLVDPNIELPAISANEVEQVLRGLQSSARPSVPCPPSHPRKITSSGASGRRTNCSWLSKDDSFTPPPIKRSLGGRVSSPIQHPATLQQSPQPGTNRSCSLMAALQLPPLGVTVGNSSQVASASPQLHATLRRQLLAPATTFITLVNAPKQRQENLSVRLANRAKLTANTALRLRSDSGQPSSVVDSDCANRTLLPQSSSSSDHNLPTDPNERFRFVCPHPRCGRRYQAPIGLTRHLVKYHGESVTSVEHAQGVNGKARSTDLGVSTDPRFQAPTAAAAAATTAVIGTCEEAATGTLQQHQNPTNRSTSSFPSISSPLTAGGQTSLRLCYPMRTVKVDHRSSRSLDRSKIERRFNSPPPACVTTTTNPPSSSPYQQTFPTATAPHLAFFNSNNNNKTPPSRVPPSPTALHYFRSQTSPSLLSNGAVGVGGGGGGKVAIVSVQHSPPSIPSQYPHHLSSGPPAPFLVTATASTSIYSNETTDATSGGALTEPWCSGHSDRTQHAVPPSSSSCCWPDNCDVDDVDYYDDDDEGEEEEEEEEECSYGGDSLLFHDGEDYDSDDLDDVESSFCHRSRPPAITDSLPCLLVGTPFPPPTSLSSSTQRNNHHHHPQYPYHPASFVHHPRGSALDLSTTNTTTATTTTTTTTDDHCWTTGDSAFSSSFSRGGRHFSEDYGDLSRDLWPSPYPQMCPHRKHRLSSTGSTSLLMNRRRYSLTREKGHRRIRRHTNRGGGGGPGRAPQNRCASRRRTLSSSGGGIFFDGATAESFETARAASVICGGGGGGIAGAQKQRSADELVACPVHDCGLVCSGCADLCEHLRECHLPDSRHKPVRLIFACPVKECRAFCSNEAAFDAHFDAHLEKRTTSSATASAANGNGPRLCDLLRRPMSQRHPSAAGVDAEMCQRRDTSARHVRSATSSVLDLESFDGLLMGGSAAATTRMPRGHQDIDDEDASGDVGMVARSSPSKIESPSTPIALWDADNCGLLQALDLLPDDVLHDLLLQEKMLNVGGTSTAPVCSSTPPATTNPQSSTCKQRQTLMVISDSPSAREASSSSCAEGVRALVARQQQPANKGSKRLRWRQQQRPMGTRPRSIHVHEYEERDVGGTHLPLHTPPPHARPSASQLLFSRKPAASTEDLFYQPPNHHHHRPLDDIPPANTTQWLFGDNGGCGGNGDHSHLSDTDMPQTQSASSPSPFAVAATFLGRPSAASMMALRKGGGGFVNRLKRRRRVAVDRVSLPLTDPRLSGTSKSPSINQSERN